MATDVTKEVLAAMESMPSPKITRDVVQLGNFVSEKLSIGDCAVKITIDDEQVGKFIDRLERAIDAFKAQWNK